MKQSSVKLRFSVVIPCFNEEKYIGRCINSILEQSYDCNLIDIIVVDGESDDGTLNIVKGFQEDNPNIRIFSNPQKKTPISLNIGIKKSTSDVIVILGAHTVLDKNFIFLNNKIMLEKNIAVCGGTQINVADTYIQKVIGLTMESPFAMASASYRWSKKGQYVDTVVYAAYKRSLFEEIGYFVEDYTISEDAELNWRIRQAGYKIYFSPDIITWYFPRKSVSMFIKQMFRYGILRVNVFKTHIKSIKLIHLIPPFFVLSLIILFTLSSLNIVDEIVLVLLLVLYFVLNIIISSISSSSKSIKYLMLIPPLTFFTHFFWGLGFLVGLFLPRSDKW